MRRNLLVVGVVLLGMLLAGAAMALPAGNPETQLVSSLTADKVTFEQAEPVMLNFTLENRGRLTVTVLKWQLPSDEIEADLFDVRRNGEPVEYLGPLVKRAAPTPDDYVEIGPGDSIKVSFDPTAVYDMAEKGEYTVRYRARLLTGVATAEIGVESNAAAFWFDGVGESARRMTEATIGGYTKCTTTQQATMVTAHNNAISITGKAKSHLAANPSGSTLYTRWFGTYTSGRFSLVSDHYLKINDAFVNKSVTYDCGCKKPYYAYVYPSQPYKIYVCKVFWTAPALGVDSKAGTLVHEMSHFYVTASTDDYVYGQAGALNLALTNPTNAVDNADNHEYFAEEQP
jgi:peptidyl-Lys metalloendopeptidase